MNTARAAGTSMATRSDVAPASGPMTAVPARGAA
jgi:hypothetical protein